MGNVSLGLTSNELDSILDKVSRNPRIQKVVLFGSRAKGNFKDGSDIDIALFGNKLKLNDILDLSADLEDLWLPNKFDLVIFDHIKEQSLIDHIERIRSKFMGATRSQTQ